MTDEPRTQKAIDIVRASSAKARRSIVVKEWGGLEIFFGKITVSDMEAVEERDPKTPQERNLILLCNKAQDSEGHPLFDKGDIHFLRTEGDFVILQRVFNFMFESAYNLAEAKAELAKNPSSASA